MSPIFEYECPNCNLQQEFITPTILEGLLCPKCNENMSHIISLSSFKLKGKGWANDNYSKNNKKELPKTSTPVTETKPIKPAKELPKT